MSPANIQKDGDSVTVKKKDPADHWSQFCKLIFQNPKTLLAFLDCFLDFQKLFLKNWEDLGEIWLHSQNERTKIEMNALKVYIWFILQSYK